MKYLRKPKSCPEIIPAEYYFTVVASNMLHCLNQIQVAFRLGKEEDKKFRVYLLETYAVDLKEGSNFRNLMDAIVYSIYPDFIVEVDTDEVVDTSGNCKIILNE